MFQYYENTLHNYLSKLRLRLSDVQVKKFIQQLLRGTAYLHDSWIMHRDIKMDNILVDESDSDDPQLIIADLGLGSSFCRAQRPKSLYVVTMNYRSFEILVGHKKYTSSIDIWSVGCIFVYLVRGCHFIACNNQDTNKDAIRKIFNTLGRPNSEIWPQLREYEDFVESIIEDKYYPLYETESKVFRENLAKFKLEESGQQLIMQMLCYNPESRITAKEALKHPYF